MDTTVLASLALAVVLALLLVLFWAALMFNQLVKARNQQREGWSGIDVQLRKRHDLVPQLVEVVRGYREHETSVLTAVTEARTQAASDPNRTDRAENALSHNLQRLMALAETYPDLKADQNFQQLGSQLVAVEDDLQFARRYYNGSVRDYRNLAESFPSNIVASLFGFRPGEFFEVESATERLAPGVKL